MRTQTVGEKIETIIVAIETMPAPCDVQHYLYCSKKSWVISPMRDLVTRPPKGCALERLAVYCGKSPHDWEANAMDLQFSAGLPRIIAWRRMHQVWTRQDQGKVAEARVALAELLRPCVEKGVIS